jgi:hypothetical protein
MMRRSTIVAAVLFLVACAEQSPLPSLPEGPQTLTGTVVETVISTARRGTHLLRQSGEDVAYLESASVNLREFQGRTIAVRGQYVRNIDPRDLPVFVVEGVTSAQNSVRPWRHDRLQMTADIPANWGIAESGGSVHLIPIGSLGPVISVRNVLGSQLPSGIAMTVGGAKTIRFLDELSGEQRLAVLRENGYIELAFTPQHFGDGDDLRAQWLAFLRSVKISGVEPPSSASRKNGSAASALREGQHCGGIAGVLCPSGQYCAITDRELNIGVCRRVEP